MQASCGNSSGVNLLPFSPREDTWSRVSAASSATTCSCGIRTEIQVNEKLQEISLIMLVFFSKFFNGSLEVREILLSLGGRFVTSSDDDDDNI